MADKDKYGSTSTTYNPMTTTGGKAKRVVASSSTSDPVATVATTTSASTRIVSALQQELMALEGNIHQNPETGAAVSSGTSFLGSYTNRLFGAPYQFMDSVDRRFPSINSELGNEYLRNIMLNSPILHIKPGLPKYTGGISADGLVQTFKNLNADIQLGGMRFVQAAMAEIGTSVFLSNTTNMKRRMFGFRETYYDYMQRCNYMLHVIASLMELAKSDGDTSPALYPSAVHTNGHTDVPEPLSTVKWENYRMINGSSVRSPAQQLEDMLFSSLPATAAKDAFDLVIGIGAGVLSTAYSLGTEGLEGAWSSIKDSASSIVDNFKSNAQSYSSMIETMSNKISTVQFMVEPVQFEESMSNETGKSLIDQTVEGLDTVGAEVAWMTNSNVDAALIDKALELVGNAATTVVNMADQFTSGISGGLVGNLFHGALGALKGQKMLYPEIYKSSTASMNYQFSMTLVSPYGDPYNYFMNIMVPTIHLLALAAPRMVTANSISSPYLVQCYIPGMCSCELGMVSEMAFTRNPDGKHVSVNGYPLTVKVNFTIKELYRNIATGAANEPESFLFNETLNDYLATMAGCIPSMDTYTSERVASFAELGNYMSVGALANDAANMVLEKLEDINNPFVGR